MKKVSEMSMAATIISPLTMLFWVLNKNNNYRTLKIKKQKKSEKKKKTKS